MTDDAYNELFESKQRMERSFIMERTAPTACWSRMMPTPFAPTPHSKIASIF